MKNLKLSDVEDSGKLLHIKIPNTKTKISRSFVVSGSFYEVCMQYIKLRQKVDANIDQFFMNYQRGKCTKQVVGINKFGKIPSQIAEYLKLENPSSYTGHCFRRTSATILVDAGGDLMALKRHGGWKSSTTAEGYVDDSLKNKTSTAMKIIGSVEAAINNGPEGTYYDSSTSVQAPSTSQAVTFSENEESVHNSVTTATTPIMIQNCHHFTINYITKN